MFSRYRQRSEVKARAELPLIARRKTGVALTVSTISVRQIGIIDIPRLRDLRRSHVSLVFPDAMHTSQFEDVLAAMPLGRRYSRVFVSETDDSPCAMVELRPEPEDYRWVVTGLGARSAGDCNLTDDVVDVWSSLLSFAVGAAGIDGAKRVHASAPVDGIAYQSLLQTGFSVYSHQSVMLAQGLHLDNEDAEDVRVREREPSDTWSIHHLYHLTTPRPVQYAEALTSNHWDSHRMLNLRTRGFVIDDRDGLAGYCQIGGRGNQHTLDLLILPGKLDMLGALISQSARLAKLNPAESVWVAIPDYHREYVPMMELLGFQEVGRQAAMVRYTMVPACVHPSRWANVVTDVIDRLPARTPVVSRCMQSRS
jgi:hypothetical protein